MGHSMGSMAVAAERKLGLLSLCFYFLRNVLVICVVRGLIRKVTEISLTCSEIILVLFLGV